MDQDFAGHSMGRPPAANPSKSINANLLNMVFHGQPWMDDCARQFSSKLRAGPRYRYSFRRPLARSSVELIPSLNDRNSWRRSDFGSPARTKPQMDPEVHWGFLT
jgi:hypothetical protein